MNPDDVSRLRTALADRYVLEGEVGRGGMAVVFRAHDLRHDRAVAVKVLPPHIVRALGPDRFLREIKLTAALHHPHILPLYDSGRVGGDEEGGGDGLLYYVMPYVEGESLRDRLNREPRLPLDDACTIAREVADGLASAHRHGVVHRDIKPENILLVEGHAVIADFGVARAVVESADERLTATGLVIGTPVYMSPEQIRGVPDIDGRADLYALACVVYETLTGEPPFSGPTVEAAIARRFTDAARPIATFRPDVPEHVERAIRRGLAEAPEHRFATTTDFAAALGAPGWTTPAAGFDPRALLRLGRNPRIAVPVAVLALALTAMAVIPLRQRAGRARAAALLPEIERLADAGAYDEAYDLAVRAEDALGRDTTLTRLMARVADHVTISSAPTGAAIWLRRFAPAAERAPDSVLVGETPIQELRVARGDYRVTAHKPRFATVERVASSAENRIVIDRSPAIRLDLRLHPADSVPARMVFIPGGSYAVTGPDAPTGLTAELDAFFLDRYEVTNAEYAAFIRAGGYQTAAYWTALVEAGVPATRRDQLRDRTGMPAPRDWTGQTFPPAENDHPVSGVTWYEAAAYCASVGKRLPTLFEWDKAARDGQRSPHGVLMPWGYSPTATTEHRASLGTGRAVPVDRYPFGISPWGVYAMAGNVKEWLANPMADGYVVTGGSWEDPVYVYSELGALAPLAAAPTVGFRCARTAGDEGGDQGAARIVADQETPVYRPVDPATFRTLLGHYRYDRRPLDPVEVETFESADWIRTLVRYVATDGDTAAAYLYLPHHAAPPYQTILYVASSGSFVNPVWMEVEWILSPVIRSGRAVFAVILKGMVGRERPPGWTPPDPPSVAFRDLMVLHATEMRRGIDYLETRDDIDRERLAYAGMSFGAGSRLVFAAVDDRFRAVVFIGGGIDERVQPTLPEAANFNFAPYIRPPKLLINGTNDEEHPWATRGLPLWNLLREPKELVLVEGAGHIPPLEARVPAINDFLNRILGTVGGR